MTMEEAQPSGPAPDGGETGGGGGQGGDAGGGGEPSGGESAQGAADAAQATANAAQSAEGGQVEVPLDDSQDAVGSTGQDEGKGVE